MKATYLMNIAKGFPVFNDLDFFGSIETPYALMINPKNKKSFIHKLTLLVVQK